MEPTAGGQMPKPSFLLRSWEGDSFCFEKETGNHENRTVGITVPCRFF